MAEDIYDKFESLSKVRFYILTNKTLSRRVVNLQYEQLEGKDVEVNAWDITRLYDIVSSKRGKERITISFNEMNSLGVSCVKAMESDKEEYSSYLGVIDGDVLAKLYITYGERLLEGNVRSFLSAKGKINQNIRTTILNRPEMFFAYNNGIAATASEISVENINGNSYITKISDLQIINGGQTTASLANSVINDKADVSKIRVPMKLSVVNPEKGDEMIPNISRFANSQNKVDESDFFSNHPYNVRLEEYSRRILSPAQGGNQYSTYWFYERARGQYFQAQIKLKGAQKERFKEKNPKSQMIKSTDLAKYVNSYNMKPQVVARGTQVNAKTFAKEITEEWKKDDTQFNELYWKNVVAMDILYKTTEKIISNSLWYKSIKSYRANLVSYSISFLSAYAG